MSREALIWDNALAHLKSVGPQEPVLYFAPTVLQQTARDFQAGFPGMVSYAIKANDSEVVLENLIAAGIIAFDVASPAEIQMVRAISQNVALHYNNPVRSPAEIAQAVSAGVVSYSVDSLRELEKLIAGVPVDGVEVAVRLHLPVKGAVYDFGGKFGADPEDSVQLLRAVAAAGFQCAMTFHPGTQCSDPKTWAEYIQVCADVSSQAGVVLKRLNVGGGFAANRGVAPDLAAIFTGIRAAVNSAFGTACPEIICEPGRALVTEAFVLATQVKGLRSCGGVFVNDGIYGSFGEAMNPVGVPNRDSTRTASGAKHTGRLSARVIYGPTCDSLDRLPGEYALPSDLSEGDYVIFKGMGAYSTATSTRFNGYGATQVVTVQSADI